MVCQCIYYAGCFNLLSACLGWWYSHVMCKCSVLRWLSTDSVVLGFFTGYGKCWATKLSKHWRHEPCQYRTAIQAKVNVKQTLQRWLNELSNIISGWPDDQDGSGGLVVGRSEHDSDRSGLPGLQQQTQDAFPNQVLLSLTCLQKKRKKLMDGKREAHCLSSCKTTSWEHQNLFFFKCMCFHFHFSLQFLSQYFKYW